MEENQNIEENRVMWVREFTEESPNFALIIDGEVVENFSFPSFLPGEMPPIIEKLIAIFKSGPTLVKTLEMIEPGSVWDGNEFTPPTETNW